MSWTHIHLLPLSLAGMLLSSAVCSAGWLQPGSPGAAGWVVDGRPDLPAPHPAGVTQLIQSDTQAWVSIVGGTATLWRTWVVAPALHDPVVVVAISAGDGYQGPPKDTVYSWNGTFQWWAGGCNNGKLLVSGSHYIYQETHAVGSYSYWGYWTNAGVSFPSTFYPMPGSPDCSFTFDYVRAAPQTSAVPLVVSDQLDVVSKGLADVSGTYPVFQLDLGGPWTDFLLKGSTNNFATCCYLVSSSAADAGNGDTNVAVYFCDDYADDPRAWVSSVPGTPIVAQLVDPVNGTVSGVIVCPSHQCDVDWSTWMLPTNSHLVWSYLRTNAAGYETNATGLAASHELQAGAQRQGDCVGAAAIACHVESAGGQ